MHKTHTKSNRTHPLFFPTLFGLLSSPSNQHHLIEDKQKTLGLVLQMFCFGKCLSFYKDFFRKTQLGIFSHSVISSCPQIFEFWISHSGYHSKTNELGMLHSSTPPPPKFYTQHCVSGNMSLSLSTLSVQACTLIKHTKRHQFDWALHLHQDLLGWCFIPHNEAHALISKALH